MIFLFFWVQVSSDTVFQLQKLVYNWFVPLYLIFINFNFNTDVIGSFNVAKKGIFTENVDAPAQISEKLKELFA